jgi:thymidylate synthase (FAD)
MKIIHPYVDLIQQEPGFDGIMKHIERCGRTCYKSEDKITDDSADTFVANLIKNKHYAMLEHGTVYLKNVAYNNSPLKKYKFNPYSIYKDVYLGKEEIEDGNNYENSIS